MHTRTKFGSKFIKKTDFSDLKISKEELKKKVKELKVFEN